MVACPACTAKFASLPELERQWLERHSARAHEARVHRVEPTDRKAA